MRVRRLVVGTVTGLGLVVTSAGAQAAPTDTSVAGSSVQAACGQPYEPWFQAITYPVQTPVPDLGAPIDYAPEPDTDGDGIPDTIVDVSNGGTSDSVTITRGDGVITLTPGPHAHISFPGPVRTPGDLDGDGRDELVIGVYDGGQQYVLPGSTAPGTHAIDDVGISTTMPLSRAAPVGDQNADGNDDVAGSDLVSLGLFSGADIMAPGPGGTLGPLTPLTTYPGWDVTAAVLSPGQVPTVITGAALDASALRGDVALTVHSEPPVDLVARDVFYQVPGSVGTIQVYQHDGATFVEQSASNRGGATVAIWNLTDPCSRYVAPIEVSATPAAPVEAATGHTG